MPREILEELYLFDNQIKEKCILIIRGRLIRYSCEDGKTAFIFQEVPRTVITDVQEKIIGEPIELIKAFNQ